MSGERFETIEQVLAAWLRRAAISLDAHYNAARHYSRRNLWIGVPAVLFSAIVGTTVFATLEKDVSTVARLVVALFSISAAVLGALQTFLGFSERAEKHKASGARYGAISREVEQVLTIPPEQLNSNSEVIDAIRHKMDSAAEEAPGLPDHIWNSAKKRHLKEF